MFSSFWYFNFIFLIIYLIVHQTDICDYSKVQKPSFLLLSWFFSCAIFNSQNYFFIHIIFLIFCSCAIVMSFFSRINCSFQIILLLLQLLLLFYIFLTGLLFLFACIFKYFIKYLENLICLSLRIRYYKVNQKFYLCTWQKLSACLKIIF
jgi:hypothetical protein